MTKSNKPIIKYIKFGELFVKYYSWIGWYGLIIFNYFFNEYLLNQIDQIESFPDESTNKMFNQLDVKLKFYSKIIKFSLFLFAGLFLYDGYLKKIFGHIMFENIFGIIYLYSELLSSNIKDINKYSIDMPGHFNFFNMIFHQYIIFEIILIMIILFPTISFGFYLLFNFINKIIYKISDIEIQYSEDKIIQMHKLV